MRSPTVGPGSPDVTPSSVADLFTGCAGEEGVVVGYNVTVPAAEIRHLLFFNQMNQTNAEALAAASGFDTNPAPDGELVSGIGAQLPDISTDRVAAKNDSKTGG